MGAEGCVRCVRCVECTETPSVWLRNQSIGGIEFLRARIVAVIVANLTRASGAPKHLQALSQRCT